MTAKNKATGTHKAARDRKTPAYICTLKAYCSQYPKDSAYTLPYGAGYLRLASLQSPKFRALRNFLEMMILLTICFVAKMAHFTYDLLRCKSTGARHEL